VERLTHGAGGTQGHQVSRILGSAALLAALLLGSGAPVAAEPSATAEPVLTSSVEPADTPDSSAVYVDDRVVLLELVMSDEAQAALRAEPSEYVAAKMTASIDGREYGPFDVGARLKGNASFRGLDGKSAWRLKFGHVVKGQRVFGLKSLTLNNMVQDPSMIAEATTYRLFRELGAPAPRTGYAYLTVNGAEYGLYANVETIDSVFAARWFTSTAHILEGELGADVTPEASGRLEVDEGEEDDLADLAALVAAASSDDSAWASAIAAVADLDSMARMWALEHLALHWDGYSVARGSPFPSNYYLHSDAAGVFAMIPSGADMSWTRSDLGGFGEVGSGSMFRRCVGIDACRDRYIAALSAIGDREADLSLAAHASHVVSAIRPWVERDPRRESGLAEVEAAQATKLAAMSQRFVELRSWLANPVFTWSDPAPPAPAPGGGSGGGSTPAEPGPSVIPAAAPQTMEDPATTAGLTEPAPPSVSTVVAQSSPLATLSGPALAALPPRQFGSLPRVELARLTRAQAAFVTVAQWRRLRPAQIAVLPPAAVRAIPVNRLRALGPTWGSALRPKQVQALRYAQVRALGLS
jgi:hypothetical protein